MKFLALVCVACAVVTAEEVEWFRDGPAPDFTHHEYLAQSVQLTASAKRAAVQSFKAASSDATELRLIFDEAAVLPAGSRVTIRSVRDNHVQYLDGDSIEQWAYHTAYFNGDEVEVTVESKAKQAQLAVIGMVVGENPPEESRNVSTRTLCYSYDDRVRNTNRPKDARFRLGGSTCSAWLINDQHGCFLSAGHCSPQRTAVFQFNVPDSTSGGGAVNPDPRFQFPVELSSNQGVNGGTGNDWRYVGANVNSNTGRSPRQEMNTRGYTLSTANTTPAPGAPWQIFGHGSASGSMNFVCKGSVGTLTSRSGNRIEYRTSTTGGDSGSAVSNPGSGPDADGFAYAIHTHGGCRASGGSNIGTWVQHPGLQNALNNPRGICQSGY